MPVPQPCHPLNPAGRTAKPRHEIAGIERQDVGMAAVRTCHCWESHGLDGGQSECRIERGDSLTISG
jgi:hypothetical protein